MSRVNRICAIEARNILSQNIDYDSDSDSSYELENDDFDFVVDPVQINEDESEEESDDENVIESEEIDKSINRVIESVVGNQTMVEFTEVDKTSKAGVIWKQIEEGKEKRVRNQITFIKKSGPTPYAIRRINESALSAFFA